MLFRPCVYLKCVVVTVLKGTCTVFDAANLIFWFTFVKLYFAKILLQDEALAQLLT